MRLSLSSHAQLPSQPRSENGSHNNRSYSFSSTDTFLDAAKLGLYTTADGLQGEGLARHQNKSSIAAPDAFVLAASVASGASPLMLIKQSTAQ